MSLEIERDVLARDINLMSSTTGGLRGMRTAIAFGNRITGEVFRAISVM